MLRDLLYEIELSAANLYSRLAERASREGLKDLAMTLYVVAAQERSQALRLRPYKTGPGTRSTRWSWFRGPVSWKMGAHLKHRSKAIQGYLGPKNLEELPWSEVLPMLGSAELFLSFWYLFTGDFCTALEELDHAKTNGIKWRYLIKIPALILGLTPAFGHEDPGPD